MRTEDDIVAQAPLVVVFGGRDFDVKPLVIRDSRSWRGEVVKLLASIPRFASMSTEDPEAFEGGITELLQGMPDKVVDLFFSYARDLDREDIEGIATDTEMAKAFKVVLDAAFPLVGSLAAVTEKVTG